MSSRLGHSDGSRSNFFDPDRVIFLWLGSSQPFMVWVWKIFPNYVKFSQHFSFVSKKSLRVSTRVKSGLASYLLQVKSKLGSGLGLENKD